MSSSPSRRPLVERGNEKETTVPKKKENSNASAFRVERLATPEPEEAPSSPPRRRQTPKKLSSPQIARNPTPRAVRSLISPKDTDKHQPKKITAAAAAATAAVPAKKAPKKKGSASKASAKTTERQPRITEAFAVQRRTKRMTESRRKQLEEQDTLSKLDAHYQDDIEEFDAGDKGKGVRAKHQLQSGAFVCEYSGDLIRMSEAERREKAYARTPEVGCYMYFFVHNSTKWCVDATKAGRIGRLINHSRSEANLRTRLVAAEGTEPRLAFFATRTIEKHEEIFYDYGDRSRQALAAHPWLKT